jgi:thioredoxin reductase
VKVAVIGSGLAAMAAAQALVARGLKPVVIDAGISAAENEVVRKLSQLQPNQWPGEDKKIAFKNHTVHGFPKKLSPRPPDGGRR